MIGTMRADELSNEHSAAFDFVDQDWIKNCQRKVAEMRWMFSEEKSRLEDLVKACDKLKKETLEKLDALDIFNKELNQHEDFLKKGAAEAKRESYDCVAMQQRQLGLEFIGQRISDLHETSWQKCRLTGSLQDTVVMVSFFQTDLDPTHHDDEIFIDFSQEANLPPALFITCRAIQDVIAHNIVSHPDPDDCDMPLGLESGSLTATSQAVATLARTDEAASLLLQSPFPSSQSNGDSSTAKANHHPDGPTTEAANSTVAAALDMTAAISNGVPNNATWSEVSKVNCPPQLKAPERIFPETNRPCCFFDISVKGDESFRMVIQLRPDKAPVMSNNFIQLCIGNRGFGYKGSRVFRCKADDHVVAGDFENNDGSGGRSALAGSRQFLAELCPLKDHKGAVRMRGMERTADGRCKVGSQFMVWVGDIHYKEYKYTLVFGKVVQGLEQLQEVSRIGMMFSAKESWLLKDQVVVTNCGVL